MQGQFHLKRRLPADPAHLFQRRFYDGFSDRRGVLIIAFNVCLRMNLIQASALTKVFNLSSNLGSLFVFLYHGACFFSTPSP